MRIARVRNISSMMIWICLGTSDGWNMCANDSSMRNQWIHVALEDVVCCSIFIRFESVKPLSCCKLQVVQQNLSVSRESLPEPASVAAVAFVPSAQRQLAAPTRLLNCSRVSLLGRRNLTGDRPTCHSLPVLRDSDTET